jgi:PTS system nitrogen regulatory IIA component
MELAEILNAESIIPHLRASSKKQALEELSHRASEMTGISERAIFDVLVERERLGTTGVGNGIAIPHGKLGDVKSLCGMFARLDTPIDFDSIDDKPVDLIFVLLAPESAGAEHLKALAWVSRMLRDKSVCDRLRRTDDRSEILEVIQESATPHAA